MTFSNLSPCCATATLHEGKASGEERNIKSIATYFAYPENKSADKAVLVLTDVLGQGFINTRLLADHFAKRGYLTVVPDLFDGDVVPLVRPQGFQIMDWLKNHTTIQVDPKITAVIEELREKHNIKSIAGVGYCFGGKYVARHLKPGAIDVGYVAHPTMLLPEELAGIQGPLSISAAVRDTVFTNESRHEAEQILDKAKVPWQVTVYSDVEHGFAVRGDLSNARVRVAKEMAFGQAITWFNAYLVS